MVNKAFSLIKNGNYFEFLVNLAKNILPSWLVVMGEAKIIETASIKSPKRGLKDVLFREAYEDDLPEILGCSDSDVGHNNLDDLFKIYFENDRICYCAEKNGKIIGYAWAFADEYKITFDKYVNSNVSIEVTNGTIFLGDLYILKKFRMSGLYPQLMHEFTEYLRDDKKYSRFIAYVDAYNRHSIKSHLHLGFSSFGTLYYLKVMFFNYMYLSSIDPVFSKCKMWIIKNRITLKF